MQFALSPILWVVSIVGNFIIDSTLLLIVSLFIFKKINKTFYKKTFLRVYLFGFLSDFIATIYLIVVYLIYDFNIYPLLKEIGFYNDFSSMILVALYYISGIAVAALCIFVLNYKYTFNYENNNDEKIRALSKKERILSALSFAILTAPYTFFIPTDFMYNLPF